MVPVTCMSRLRVNHPYLFNFIHHRRVLVPYVSSDSEKNCVHWLWRKSIQIQAPGALSILIRFYHVHRYR